MKFFIITLLSGITFLNCTGGFVSMSTQNVTKPLVIGKNSHKSCENAKETISNWYAVAGTRTIGATTSDLNYDEYDMRVIQADPKDQYLTVVDEIYFDAWNIPFFANSWLGIEGKVCKE